MLNHKLFQQNEAVNYIFFILFQKNNTKMRDSNLELWFNTVQESTL